MAAAFDLRRLALTSEAIPVLDGILPSQFTGAAHYSFSTTGSLVYDGRELFYREGSKMMAVDVTTEPAFSAGKPKMLFDGVDPGWQTDRISLEPGRSREHLLAIGRR